MKRRNTKGQISVEYIATYGWAFIIIFATLGALFYFNVFDFSPYVDSRCDFYSGIYCTEFVANQSGVIVVLQNGLPITLENVTVNIEECGLATGTSTLNASQKETYVADCTLPETLVFESTIEFNYTNPDSGIEHTKRGRILETIR